MGGGKDEEKDSTLEQYRAKADRDLDRLIAMRALHPAGRTLHAQVKAWRTKFFVVLEDQVARPLRTFNVHEMTVDVDGAEA